jgi:superfamily II DNA or RNA helicase
MILKLRLNRRQCFIETKTTKEVEARDAVKDALSYSVPGARFSPMFNRRDEDGNRIWDGRKSFVQRDSFSVGLLLGAQQELRDVGFKIRILSWDNRPHVRTKRGMTMPDEKYTYQNECVQNMIASLNKGGGLVLAATGVGKTAMAAQFFSWIDGHCLFIVDQLHLMYQTQQELQKWTTEKIGIVGESKFELQRVTVGTIQTISRKKNDREFKKWFKRIDVVIVDELHKQMGKRSFSALNAIQAQAVFGLTATLEMKKKQIRWNAYSIAGKILFEFPIAKGIEEKVISDAIIYQVEVC